MNKKTKKIIMNKEHQHILDLLDKHFKETPQEEVEKLSEMFYNPSENEVTVNEYFDNFAESHGYLQELEKVNPSNFEFVFADEEQHNVGKKEVLFDTFTAKKIKNQLHTGDTTYSQTMYYSAA